MFIIDDLCIFYGMCLNVEKRKTSFTMCFRPFRSAAALISRSSLHWFCSRRTFCFHFISFNMKSQLGFDEILHCIVRPPPRRCWTSNAGRNKKKPEGFKIHRCLLSFNTELYPKIILPRALNKNKTWRLCNLWKINNGQRGLSLWIIFLTNIDCVVIAAAASGNEQKNLECGKWQNRLSRLNVVKLLFMHVRDVCIEDNTN